jgi:hypothetical protein
MRQAAWTVPCERTVTARSVGACSGNLTSDPVRLRRTVELRSWPCAMRGDNGRRDVSLTAYELSGHTRANARVWSA